MAKLKLRDDQVPVVDGIMKDFEDGYKVIALNASTGVGKSPILMSIIKQLQMTGYSTTPLRTLVNQYKDTIMRFPESEFGWVVMGRGAYPCPHLQANEEKRFAKLPEEEKIATEWKHTKRLESMTADGAPCTRHNPFLGEFFVEGEIGQKDEYVIGCPERFGCPYYNNRDKAMSVDNAIMTLDYFLHSPANAIKKEYLKEEEDVYDEKIDEREEEKQHLGWHQRNILVIDEAHFLSSKLADVYSINVTERSFPGFNYRKIIENIEERKKTLSPTNSFSEVVVEEFRNEFLPYYENEEIRMKMMEDVKKIEGKDVNYNYHGKDMPIEDAIVKHTKFLYKLQFVERTITPEVEFVYSHDEKGFYLKPYTAKDYVKPLWKTFDHIILSSATLFDVPSYLEDLGLSGYRWKQIDVSAPFNPENGPIFNASNLYLSMKNFDSTIDGVAKRVDEILDDHRHERGIIHCFSEKYRKAIYERTKNRERMVLHDSFNRQEVLKNFTANVAEGDNSVLLSVNMGEGVDLKDDIARFQIIVKCPFLPMGDPWIALHKERSGKWYRNQAIIELMQMSGRIVRSKEDFGFTYIIDANAWNLLQNSRKELQEHHPWFTERMDAGTRQKKAKMELTTKSLLDDILDN